MTRIINSQFTPETTIYLLKGVECDAMHNTYWGCFNDEKEQFDFFMNNFESGKIKYQNYTYQRADGSVVVDGEFDDLRKYNYMIYQNKKSGSASKWIYCFITGVAYVNDITTAITFETDVIQTWRFEIEKSFLPSFVAFEHRDRWYYNEDGKRLPCVNTQPENIEIGDNMIARYSSRVDGYESGEISFLIISMTESFSGASNPAVEHGVVGMIRHYIFPFNSNTQNGVINGFVVNDNGVDKTLTDFSTIYNKIRNDENFVNKCAGIIMTNTLFGLKSYVDGSTDKVKFSKGYDVINDGDFTVLVPSALPLNTYFSTIDSTIEKEYSKTFNILTHLYFMKETKLFFSPFTYLVMSNGNGSTKVFQNELWDDITNVKFLEVGTIDTTKADYIPVGYKVKKNQEGLGEDNELYSINDAFEDGYEMSIPVVSDYTAVLMQTSKNSMNVGVSNTIRTNETSLRIASLTGQAMTNQTGIQNSMRSQLTANNNFLNSQLTGYQNELTNVGMWTGITGSFGSAIGNLAMGNVGGAIGSILGGAGNVANSMAQMKANNLTMQAQNANASANTAVTNNASSQITAIQNKLRNVTTQYQATTNIQNALDAYQAKIHDANATADSIVSGGSDVYRIISLSLQMPMLYVYTPTDEYIQRASQLFNIRGYATNLVKIPNLKTRKFWNYVQTEQCNIVSNDIDASDLEKIKRVFDNGITLWHTKDICDYSKNNVETTDAHNVDKFGNIKE